MSHFLSGLRPRCRRIRLRLHPVQVRDLIREPDLQLGADRIERVPLRLGRCRTWTVHDEDGEKGAADEILFHPKPLQDLRVCGSVPTWMRLGEPPLCL